MPPLPKKLKGYTLLEAIVAIAMFAVVMLAVTQVFGATFSAYRETRILQRNIENAQFAMNTMAKELRTSSVVWVNHAGTLDIRFIDYSQNGGKGKCIQYYVNPFSKVFNKWARDMANTDPNVNRTTCSTIAWGPGDLVVGGLVSSVETSESSVVMSNASGPKRVGKVTVILKIDTGANSRTIQTSVSLRDFNYVGI